MTSEIRANTIKNRVGLGTVSYTNTGIVVSGIVTANSFSATGDLDVDGHTNLDNVSVAGVTTFSDHINLPDNKQIKFGGSADFKIEHNTNENYIDSNSGHIYIRANVNDDEGDNIIIQAMSGEDSIKAIHDGAVELSHNGTKKFETTSTGFNGSGSSFNLQTSDSGAVNLRLQNSSTGTGTNDGFLIQLDSNEDGYIWHRENQNIIFGTADTTRWKIDNNGHFLSGSPGGYNIGSASAEIGNVYIADNKKVFLGSDQDFTLHHNNSHAIVKNATGRLYVLSDDLWFKNQADDSSLARFQNGDQVTLYYNGGSRFVTTNEGATFSTGSSSCVVRLTSNNSSEHVLQAFNNDLLIKAPSSGGISLVTNASNTSVLITSDGKVGVGADNPTGTLSIASGTFQTTTPTSTGDDIVISGNQSLGMQFLTLASNTSNNNIYFGDTDDPDVGMIRYAHADNSMQFRTNTGERFRIDGNGKITQTAATNTVATLDLYGGNSTVSAVGEVNAQIRFRSKDISVTNAEENVGGSIKSIVEYSNGAYVGLSFETYKQDRTPRLQEAVRITHDGKFGIGIDNPGQKLHVEGGSIRIRGTGSNETNGQVDFGDDYRILKYTDQNTMTLQSPNKVVICIDNNDNSTDSMFQIKKDTTNADSGGTQLFIVQEDGKVRVGSGGPSYNFEVQSTGFVEAVIGSTNAGGASLIFDGDANGDGGGGDYSQIFHDTSGDMNYRARGSGGASDHIFLTGTSEKLRIYAQMGVSMQTNDTFDNSGNPQNGVGYGERTRIYPYWVSDTGACRFNISFHPSINVATPQFWVFTNATNHLTGSVEIGANSRTNSPNNAVQRYHHSKWNVGLYGEGDNDFSVARWRDSQMTQKGNTIDQSGGYYYIHSSHSEYGTNANQYQNGYGGWYWHLDNGNYWQGQKVIFDMYFTNGGFSPWYAYIDD